MDSPKLTRDQAEAFRKRIMPTVAFLDRAKQRLDKIGFTPRTKLYQEVDKVHKALFFLSVELRYMSVGEGVWRAPDDEQAE
jgi:hypothetical protein